MNEIQNPTELNVLGGFAKFHLCRSKIKRRLQYLLCYLNLNSHSRSFPKRTDRQCSSMDTLYSLLSSSVLHGFKMCSYVVTAFICCCTFGCLPMHFFPRKVISSSLEKMYFIMCEILCVIHPLRKNCKFVSPLIYSGVDRW